MAGVAAHVVFAGEYRHCFCLGGYDKNCRQDQQEEYEEDAKGDVVGAIVVGGHEFSFFYMLHWSVCLMIL
jgi:hypothetical protein